MRLIFERKKNKKPKTQIISGVQQGPGSHYDPTYVADVVDPQSSTIYENADHVAHNPMDEVEDEHKVLPVIPHDAHTDAESHGGLPAAVEGYSQDEPQSIYGTQRLLGRSARRKSNRSKDSDKKLLRIEIFN